MTKESSMTFQEAREYAKKNKEKAFTDPKIVQELKSENGVIFGRKNGETIGKTNLRVGYTEGLYYGGNIGYMVDQAQRGNGYAVRACRLLARVARAHGMTKLLITNRHDNAASMRVCEKLGARLLRVAPTPAWHDLYQKGDRFGNIYEWRIL